MISVEEAQRYRALKKWLLDKQIVDFIWLPLGDSDPFVRDGKCYGETFDAAVDTLPLDGEKE